MGRLDEKVAIVTGGAMGQGAGIVRAYVAEGARVAIADVAKEQGAMIIAITRPGTPLAERADVVLPVVVPADPSMRVGTEAYLAQMAYVEILMVGTGLRRGPPALRQLKRVRQVLQERGVDSETHPVLERAWSNGDTLHS